MNYTVHLYDPTDNCERRRGYAAEYCSSLIDSVIDPATCAAPQYTVYTPVKSVGDIDAELNRIGGLGGKISSLLIHSHGAPGRVCIPIKPPTVCLAATNVSQLKSACQRAMAPGANVFFLGCNIAEGPQGEAFLRVAGPHMLGVGGGLMFAATSVTLSFPIAGQLLPPWGSTRVAHVSPGGVTFISTIP
jgi:hypothetical protein